MQSTCLIFSIKRNVYNEDNFIHFATFKQMHFYRIMPITGIIHCRCAAAAAANTKIDAFYIHDGAICCFVICRWLARTINGIVLMQLYNIL